MASDRVYYSEMREDDLDYIDPNENILEVELECEKRLKLIKYDWTVDSASTALFKACKIGRYKTVEQIINDTAADLNSKDQWDSTPLYYACLCGHADIVTLLMQNGAKCSPATFEGERCLYGALTNTIKEMLVAAAQITSTIKLRDEFSEHMRRLQEGQGADFTIRCIGGQVKCHKFILSARVAYFRRRFLDKWSNKSSILCKIPLDHLNYFMDYVYTAACSIPVVELDDVRKVGEQLKCDDFVALLDHEFDVMTEWSRLKPTVGGTIRQIDVYGDKDLLRHDLDNAGLSDVKLVNKSGDSILGHKCVFLSRSDFFQALFEDHFHESNVQHDSFCLANISGNALRALKTYCYTEHFPENLDEEDLVEILEMSDFYLLPGMKKVITNYMIPYLDNNNVLEWLMRARLFTIGRFEERCLWQIASNFEFFCQPESGLDFIIESDASAVKNRQKEDSIEIVDELRFQFTKLSNSAELNQLLDVKLDQLGLKTFDVFLNE